LYNHHHPFDTRFFWSILYRFALLKLEPFALIQRHPLPVDWFYCCEFEHSRAQWLQWNMLESGEILHITPSHK
jgi:hypothetical protein